VAYGDETAGRLDIVHYSHQMNTMIITLFLSYAAFTLPCKVA